MLLAALDVIPWNLICHNLLTLLSLPEGTKNCLGLGLNFCIAIFVLNTMTGTFSRLRDNLCRLYALYSHVDNNNRDYISSLYIYIHSDYKLKPLL